MQFQVPQFIQREMKIAGPLTFKQTLFVGGAGLCCLVLYVLLAEKSFLLFISIAILIIGTGVALAFVKVQGRPLPTVISNFFLFSLSEKTYFWQKKAIMPKVIKMTKQMPKKEKKAPSLKVSEKSPLQDLSTKLEIGIK